MKKLFKRIRLHFQLFTRDELYDFGVNMAIKRDEGKDYPSHADVENHIHDLKDNT